MRPYIVVGLTLSLLLGAATSEVQATTYNYSTTVALDQSAVSTGAYLQYGFSGTPLNLQAGDTITGSITFSNGSLSIGGNVYWLDFDFFPSGYAGTEFTSNVTLLGLSGALGTSNPGSFGPAYGNSVVGADFGAINSPSENFSFTGIDYTIHILSITDIANAEIIKPFSFSRIDIKADSVQFNSSLATPLPAALPLFATGLGALGLLGWRRKRKANR